MALTVPPFCALSDLASEWNDIMNDFPSHGGVAMYHVMHSECLRGGGWTATDGGYIRLPQHGKLLFQVPIFKLLVLVGVYPIFVEACKATPPNVWFAYMLNHMDKENSVDLKNHECLANWQVETTTE